MNTKVSGGCEKVCQCLLSSFSGASLSESTADVHLAGLLLPCHTSSNWEDGPSRRLPNLSGWADLVQDVVAGLQALPPRLCLDLGTQVVALLQLLEAATGVGFCHHCCHPRPHCTCMGAYQPAPPHIVEPDCSAGPGIWSDLHLQGSNRSEYSPGRYAWIRGTSSRPHPSSFLHLEHTPSRGPSTPRATCIPIISASCGEGHLAECHYRQAGSGYEGYGTTGSTAISSKIASPTTAGSLDGATCVPATPTLWELAGNPIPAGGAAASQA